MTTAELGAARHRRVRGRRGAQPPDEYLDGTTERGRKRLRDVIAEKFHFTSRLSVEYQTLEGTIEAIGLPRRQLAARIAGQR